MFIIDQNVTALHNTVSTFGWCITFQLTYTSPKLLLQLQLQIQAHYLPGVGAGGNGIDGGGKAGGPGLVRITYISNSSFIRKSLLFLLLFLSLSLSSCHCSDSNISNFYLFTFMPIVTVIVLTTTCYQYHFIQIAALSAMPSSMPSSAPTGQPTSQPTSRPTAKIIQPTSRPTSASENPLFIPPIAKGSMNGLDTQTAIIVFSCVGAVVLCLFILFTCYFQDKFYNHKEEDKLHNLVEQHYNDDEVALDDGDGKYHAIPYALPSLFFIVAMIYEFIFIGLFRRFIPLTHLRYLNISFPYTTLDILLNCNEIFFIPLSLYGLNCLTFTHIFYFMYLYFFAGGRNVEIESGYYRQFGENDNPIHNQTDENGNVISNSLRSSSTYTLPCIGALQLVFYAFSIRDMYLQQSN